MVRGDAGTVTVTVDDHEWSLVSSLRDAGSSDAAYVLNQETGSIRFGDGVHGARPRVGSTITVRYSRGAGSVGNISKRIDENVDVEKFWVIVGECQQALGWGDRYGATEQGR
jgi:alpha-N-arabinofuranosidase